MVCNSHIDNGMKLRYIVTIICLYVISLLANHQNIVQSYLYVLLPITLTFLDSIDNLFKYYHYYDNRIKRCVKTFHYQYTDKICDVVSYGFMFMFFKLDNILLYLILFRTIGVVLFSITKKSIWLVVFFDFVKEYLVYSFVFGKNTQYLPIFILLKIAFEYYFHMIYNKNSVKMLHSE